MSEHRRTTDYMQYWPVALFVGGSLVAWGVLQTQVVTAKDRIEKVCERTENHETRISKAEQAMEQLPEIRADIKELLKRVK